MLCSIAIAQLDGSRDGATTATVDWNAVQGTVPRSAFGLNAFQGFRTQNQAYRKNLAFMNPGLIRFHNGGAMQDSSTPDGLIDRDRKTWDARKVKSALAASFSTFGKQQPQRMINIPTWADWMDADQDGFLDANQFDRFAQLCADLVRLVNRESRFGVKYWEITNEKDNTYFSQFRNGGGWGSLKDDAKPDRLNELIAIYTKAAIAMKKVDPTIQVGAPAIERSDLQPFYVPFIKGTANHLDFFTYHFYATGSASTPDSEIYEATRSIASRTETMVQAVKTAIPNRSIPVILGEYNISWTWETRDPRMTNHKGVVFDALSMIRALSKGATATLAWNEKDGVYGKTDDQNKLRLSGRFFQLINRFLIGDRVRSVTNNEKDITTFAVKNQALHHRSYLIVNHSSKSQPIKTNFGSYRPKRLSVERYELSASGYAKKAIGWNAVQKGIVVPDNSVTLLVFADP